LVQLVEDDPVNDLIRVNLHCHSNLSDGQLSPELLAERLARSGVRVAALTDHDTVAGLDRFRAALARRGVGCIPGLELSTTSGEGPLHLLAYGFDPRSPHLQEALRRVREAGGLTPAEGIRLIHGAGGRAFLAHPLEVEPEIPRLRERLLALRSQGLDGLEAVYAPYSTEQIHGLLNLARELDLAVSAGCDFHGPDVQGLSDLGINVPTEAWRAFRSLVLASPGTPAPPSPPALPAAKRPLPRLDWKNFLWRILAPTLVAIVLLLVPLFAYLVPAFEDALLSRKREMIRELTNSACSILEEYRQEAAAGRLSLAEAQAAAASRIQFLRYGREGKDYFWITDLQPRMVMHPYREDLNGKDLAGFQDPKGNRVFVAFADLVKGRREGYLEYVWQWKDDPGRLVPKQSYVRLFEPWGWVVGTGIYMEDVQAETRALTGRILRISVFLALVIALLLLFVAQQSFRIERQRKVAEEALEDSHERYRALVEASKEGTVMVLRGRAVFANPVFLEMAGLTETEWGLMELEELLVVEGGLPPWMEAVLSGRADPDPVEGRLLRRAGASLEVLLSVERIQIGGQDGAILIVRDLSAHKEVLKALSESQARFRAVAENLRLGVFRASVEPGLPVREANAAATDLLGLPLEPGARLDLSFGEAGALEAFRADLLAQGEVKARILHLREDLGGAPVALSATLVRDGAGEPTFCDAVAEDVTAQLREAQARDALIAELQTALLYLGEPVKGFMREPLSADMRTSIGEAAGLMSRADLSALLIKGPGGEALGLLTDHDLRDRVVAKGLDAGRPVFEVMSSPLLSVPPDAQGHEALMLMREKGIQHLAVADPGGAVLGLLRGQDLLHADRYPVALLIRAIREASRPEEVIAQRQRLPILVKALVDSGARPGHVCRAITGVSDAVTEKLLAFALPALGESPAPFAFLVLGSQGREEQTLLSDQDSALVYALPEGADPEALQVHFLALAERTGEWLEAAGYPACKGGMMARNPRWCRPLRGWKAHFSGWIRLAEPQNLLEFGTFYDFRCIHGEASLAAELRDHVRREMAATPGFLVHLAQEVMQYKAATGLFGGLLPHGQRSLDLKEFMAPMVHIGRLYALRHGIPETATAARFQRMNELGLLSNSGHEELIQGYDFLMGLRLRHQAECLAAGRPGDNLVELKSLTHLEESFLKQVSAQVVLLQKKVGFEFLGQG
jgi:PAS domain S-box-containing protein